MTRDDEDRRWAELTADPDAWIESNRRLWALMAIERHCLPVTDYQELVHHVMSLLGLNGDGHQMDAHYGMAQALDLLEHRRRQRR